MTTTPIASRGWCCLSTCVQGPVAQDCVRFGPFAVCVVCLIDLGGGSGAEELETAEEVLEERNTRIDVLEEELEKLKAKIQLEQKEVSSD